MTESQQLPLSEELAAVHARMSGLLLSSETIGGALRLVTALATELVPGTVGAGITLVDEQGEPTTSAATDRVVERADALQYELDEGPCLTAWQERRTVRIDDVDVEDRWPRWSAAVAGTGLHSCVSAALVAGDESLGAIKLYSSQVAAYGMHSEHVLRMFAGQAAILVSNVQSAERARRMTEDLRAAIRSRDTISLAKGIVMAREDVSEEDALAMLLALARTGQRALPDVAREIVRSPGRRRR